MGRAIPLNDLPVFSANKEPDPSFNFGSGAAFIVNKPKGWSSYEVVRHLRKAVDLHKVGHAGTLDPMATGVLVVCCGKGTKSVSQIQELPKEYIGEITFGASTASHDVETDIQKTADSSHITQELIQQQLDEEFSGQIVQVPPMYSALKRNGTPLYKLARKGKKVKRPPRQVLIYKTDILDFKEAVLKLYVKCSKGTYIRTIAYDLGKAVDSLAHLTALKRVAIGPFKVDDALSIEKINSIFSIDG